MLPKSLQSDLPQTKWYKVARSGLTTFGIDVCACGNSHALNYKSMDVIACPQLVFARTFTRHAQRSALVFENSHPPTCTSRSHLQQPSCPQPTALAIGDPDATPVSVFRVLISFVSLVHQQRKPSPLKPPAHSVTQSIPCPQCHQSTSHPCSELGRRVHLTVCMRHHSPSPVVPLNHLPFK